MTSDLDWFRLAGMDDGKNLKRFSGFVQWNVARFNVSVLSRVTKNLDEIWLTRVFEVGIEGETVLVSGHANNMDS